MYLKISFSYIITFLLLTLVMMELHEIVHISVERILCGCWGPRDFNVWSLCEGCKETQPLWWLATLAGPLFSFALMWLGMYWTYNPDHTKKALGFALIFSNIPFGRITTVMMGGGDELVVIRNFLSDDFTRTQMIVIGSLLLLAVGVPPIWAAYRVLTNKRSWIHIVAFLNLPLLFLLLYILIGLNTILSSGFLADPWIMGTPLLITVHTLVAAILLIWLRKNLI